MSVSTNPISSIDSDSSDVITAVLHNTVPSIEYVLVVRDLGVHPNRRSVLFVIAIPQEVNMHFRSNLFDVVNAFVSLLTSRHSLFRIGTEHGRGIFSIMNCCDEENDYMCPIVYSPRVENSVYARITALVRHGEWVNNPVVPGVHTFGPYFDIFDICNWLQFTGRLAFSRVVRDAKSKRVYVLDAFHD